MWLSRSLCAASLLVLAGVGTANAGGFVHDEETIGATAGSSTSDVEAEAPVSVVTCMWVRDQLHYRSGQSTLAGDVYTYIDQMYWRFRPSTGEVWVQALRTCRRGDEVVSSGLGWRRVVAPDPRVLGESLVEEVTERVPLPVPALSPVGPGFVNLGMWLAVEDPGVVSVTARAGGVWATTSAVLVSTSFSMGDGAEVVCAGVGDPIPSSMLGSVEASPVCGHTYRSVNDRVPFEVVIRSVWQVSWAGSGGVGGDLGTLERSASLEYEVSEIQTVGG